MLTTARLFDYRAVLVLGLALVSGVTHSVTAQANAAAQQNAARQATLELERTGALVIRDFRKYFGVNDERCGNLKTRLDELISEFVKKNPPPVLDWGAPPPIKLEKILEMPGWREILLTTLDKKELEAYDTFLADGKKRLADAAVAYIGTVMSAEFRLTQEQRQKLASTFERFAKSEIDAPPTQDWYGWSQIGQRFVTADAQGDQVLTPTQAQNPPSNRGRNVLRELSLEAERLRLVAALSEKAARLVKAVAIRAAKDVLAEDSKRRAEEAKARQDRKKAAGENADTQEIVDEDGDGVPDDETRDDPESPYLCAFWKKARTSLLDEEQRKKADADQPADLAAVRAARTKLVLIQLETTLHLDQRQAESLRELASRQVKHTTQMGRPLNLFALDVFGMRDPNSQYSERNSNPKDRGARRALEDLLDRDQLDFLKDRIIP